MCLLLILSSGTNKSYYASLIATFILLKLPNVYISTKSSLMDIYSSQLQHTAALFLLRRRVNTLRSLRDRSGFTHPLLGVTTGRVNEKQTSAILVTVYTIHFPPAT